MRLLAAHAVLMAAALAGSYEDEIRQWREQREAALKRDDGWLAVAGLFWLKEGRNTAGSAPANDIVLPEGAAPERVGTFVLADGKTVFVAEPGAKVTANGKPVERLEMRPDTEGSPDIIAVNGLTMHVIGRDNRYAIRLRDKNSKFRREFTGLEWFPVSEAWRVTAKFYPYDPPKEIVVPNVLGYSEKQKSPGYVTFTIDGKKCRLEPVSSGDRLWFIFKDLTSRKETYPAGRFLYADAPKNGEVILDFNKAYNPPCAFTPYATCPLPPKQNHLPLRIPAGEKNYHY